MQKQHILENYVTGIGWLVCEARNPYEACRRRTRMVDACEVFDTAADDSAAPTPKPTAQLNQRARKSYLLFVCDAWTPGSVSDALVILNHTSMPRSPLPASCGRKGRQHRGGGTATEACTCIASSILSTAMTLSFRTHKNFQKPRWTDA